MRGPTQRMQSKRSRIAAAAFIAAGVAVAVNGCSLLEAVDPPIQSAIYATAPEGKAADAPVAIPSWIPDDAMMVRVKINHDTGAEILMFTPAKNEQIGTPCTAVPSQNPPALDDTWWLSALPPDESITCQDGWYFTGANSLYYAWKNS
jgi:hypothetical protein